MSADIFLIVAIIDIITEEAVKLVGARRRQPPLL